MRGNIKKKLLEDPFKVVTFGQYPKERRFFMRMASLSRQGSVNNGPTLHGLKYIAILKLGFEEKKNQ